MSETSHNELDQLRQTVRVNRQVINRLKERMAILENALELVCDDPQMLWLYRNRSERMDATISLYSPSRAAFHMARYQFANHLVHGKIVADIACGTGYGCRTLAEQGGASAVTGIDLCAEAIQYAESKHRVDGSTYMCADARNTQLTSESLDVIVSFETIEHVTDDHKLMDEFSRLLKPAGTLVCSTPNQWPLEIAPHHVRVYDRESFHQVLAERFVIQQMYNQNSGSDFKYNHDQPAGMVETTDGNHHLAECFVAVARKK